MLGLGLCAAVLLMIGLMLAVAYIRWKQQPTASNIVQAVLAVKKEDEARAATQAAGTATTPSATKAASTATTKAASTTTPSAVAATKAGGVVGFVDEHKAVLIAVPVQAVSLIAVKAAMKALTGRTEQSLTKYTLRVASRALEKMGAQVGEKLLVRLGIRSVERAGVALASQGAVAAASGPGAPFVEAAALCFDALSLSLDAADAGGYNKLQTEQTYLEMKAEVDKEFQKAFADQGVPLPVVSGPLDKLSATDLQAKVTATTQDILAAAGNKYMKPLQDAMGAWLVKNPLAQEADIDTWSTSFLAANPIDNDALTADALSRVCTSAGGTPGDAGVCSYSTKASCLSSYSWPLKPDDVYSEWVDGKCQLASQGMRGICEQNSLAYNQDTHVCDVTETYCKSKGADWKYNDAIKQNDCSIPLGQSVAEAIFGTTIVRGLKQIFSMDQYEKCKDGETDDGFFCRSTSCPDGQENSAGLCYAKCKSGYAGVGPVCYSNCEAGYTDDGAFCRRAGYCPPGTDHNGALCYPQCKPGYSGIGPMCWGGCPSGYPDSGATFCSKPSSYGRGVGYPWKFGDALNNNGMLARCAKDNPQGCEVSSAIAYPKCKAGFHAVGCCVCSPDCPPGTSDTGATCEKDRYGRGAGDPDTTVKAKDSYGRGVGTPAVHIRAKKRVVPWSTKNN